MNIITEARFRVLFLGYDSLQAIQVIEGKYNGRKGFWVRAMKVGEQLPRNNEAFQPMSLAEVRELIKNKTCLTPERACFLGLILTDGFDGTKVPFLEPLFVGSIHLN